MSHSSIYFRSFHPYYMRFYFRSFHPYSFPGNKDTHGINTARTVEVWMDDYKKLFYMHRPDLLSTSIGKPQKNNLSKYYKKYKVKII